MNDLTVIETLSEHVDICQMGGVKVVKIDHEMASAGISLFGGHLLWFKPKGEREVLWLSEDADWTGSKAIRGGVPICFPWFGNAGGEQTHGFARNLEWELLSHTESATGVEISLSLSDSEQTLPLWPHKFNSTLKFSLSNDLKISLMTENTDEKDWTYSGAIHTYFKVSDIAKTQISGVGQRYYDGVQDYVECQGENVMTIDKETIRVCIDPQDTIVVTDSDEEKNITVENHGHNAAVVWNPWKETTQAMADMPDEDYKKMLCVESTIYGQTPVTVKVGEVHTLDTVISLRA